MAFTRKNIKEFAERMNFSVIESGSKVILIAKFEFSDGYRPSTTPLTTREAFMYLQGFSDGKYVGISDQILTQFMKTRCEIVDTVCKAINQWTSGDYNPMGLYCNVSGQHEHGNSIARAIDAVTNEDIISAIVDCLREYFHPEDPFL